MGRVSGDKGRFNKDRRKKIARREITRALGKKLRAEALPPAKGAPRVP